MPPLYYILSLIENINASFILSSVVLLKYDFLPCSELYFLIIEDSVQFLLPWSLMSVSLNSAHFEGACPITLDEQCIAVWSNFFKFFISLTI